MNVVAPHLVEDLGAAVDAVGVRHEEVQQLNRSGPCAASGSPCTVRVAGFNTSDLDRFLGKLRRAPAQHRWMRASSSRGEKGLVT
jgi:hypothetical protein